MANKKALFVDRDGILNEIVLRDGNIHSPNNWEEMRFYPEIERLAEFKKLGFFLILITNQPDIERGIVSQSFIDEAHQQLKDRCGFDAIYCCPFSSNEHPDKKPNPGMLLRATKDWGLTLSESFFLGDTQRDVDAAKRCGCKSILWDRAYNKTLKADHRVTNFEELKSLLDSPK